MHFGDFFNLNLSTNSCRFAFRNQNETSVARRDVICLLSSSTVIQHLSFTVLAHTLYLSPSHSTPFFLCPAVTDSTTKWFPRADTHRHAHISCVLSNMMCHYYNSSGDETTHAVSFQKRGWGRQTNLYMNKNSIRMTEYCISAFTWIINNK